MRENSDGEDVGDGIHTHRSTQAHAQTAVVGVLDDTKTMKIEMPIAARGVTAISAARALLAALEDGGLLRETSYSSIESGGGGGGRGGGAGSSSLLSEPLGSLSLSPDNTRLLTSVIPDRSSSSDLASAATSAALAALRFGTAAAEAAMNALNSPEDEEEE